MISLGLPADKKKPLKLLCLGAHSDDIEIGCGASVLRLLQDYPNAEVWWSVFAAREEREREAQLSARAFLRKAGKQTIVTHSFRDGFFPYEGAAIKEKFEALKGYVKPDLIFTHYRNDLHQDHRTISELTRNTWRDHLILEYEIPKWDGDLDRPNVFIPVPATLAKRKTAYLMKHFPTQAKRHWFDEETFLGLMRVRGLECNAPGRYAEAFHGHKIAL